MESRLVGTLARFTSGVHGLDLFPYSSGPGLKFLAQHAQPIVVVTALSYVVWGDPKRAQNTPDLARLNRVPFHTHPNHDIVAVSREDVRALVAGTYFWNMVCWDARRTPLPSTLADQSARVARQGHWRPRTAALHMLDGAQLYLWSHDDAYFQFEARQADLVRRLFAEAVANTVAAAVEGASGKSVDIEPASDAIIDHIWQTVPSFELRAMAALQKRGRVRLNFGERRHPIEQGDFEPIGHVEYDLPTGRWVHRYH